MEKLHELLQDVLNTELIQGIISNPRTKDGILKIKVRPIVKKDLLFFQFESFKGKQAFHENLTLEEAKCRILEYMGDFKQLQLHTKTMVYTVLISKKGTVTVQKKKQSMDVKAVSLDHNRNKNYILQEGTMIPFLQDLGVMTSEGKIVRSRFDKFRQMNRFLEFIEDILPQLDTGRELTILDFGCGKSYLTFAMYYYLHELKNYDIRVIGLDLKKDVIEHCGQLAERYGYDKLTFLEGDIADYEGVQSVDMVVTLHACDTATDYALAKAVGWDAKVILSVPCCQHEMNTQIKNQVLAPIVEYGLLKERFAALITDGLRAKHLEAAGYDAQVLEFIDMEHTPKNILIRAVKTGKINDKAINQIIECEEFLGGKLTLHDLLHQMGK